MNDDSDDVYQLCAAIRFCASGDGLLIPVYSSYPRNQYFIASTDCSMLIDSFQELDFLLEHIVQTDSAFQEKTQFMIGDATPIIMSVNDSLVTVHGDDIRGIIESINILGIGDEPLVRELVDHLEDLDKSPLEDARARDGEWSDLYESEVDPKPARLWLDVAIQDLDERFKSASDIEQAKGKVRLQLLAWASNIADVATTPVFQHFLWAARKVERQGVYVEDILAAAIVNWVCQDVGRLDRLVDLVREFRQSYNRGPLTSVLELAGQQVPTLARWAKRSLDNYYRYMRKIVDSAPPYHLLVITFVADDGEHWPADIRTKLGKRAEKYAKELRSLLSRRQGLVDELELGRRRRQDPAARADLYRSQRSLEVTIRNTTATLDAVTKALATSDKYGDYTRRFRGIDYNALGLSRDFFLRIDHYPVLENG